MNRKIKVVLTVLTLLATAYRADAVRTQAQTSPVIVADESSNISPVWPPIWWPGLT